MSRGTRLTWAAWSLVFVVGAVVFGLWPKDIHLAECGSVFDPAKAAEMIHEAKQECGFALDRRAVVVWGLVIPGAACALTASVGGALFSPRTPAYRDTRLG